MIACTTYGNLKKILSFACLYQPLCGILELLSKHVMPILSLFHLPACLYVFVFEFSMYVNVLFSSLVLNLSANCRCVITGNGSASYSYLGRPWGPFGRVVFAYTWVDACIKPAGWHNWDKCENERTACFYEYRYVKHTSFNLIFNESRIIGG